MLKVVKIDRETAELEPLAQLCKLSYLYVYETSLTVSSIDVYAGSVQIDDDFEIINRTRAKVLRDNIKESSGAQLVGENLEQIEAQKTAAIQRFESMKLEWGTPSGVRIPGNVYPFGSPVLPGSVDLKVEVSWYVDYMALDVNILD